MVAPGEEQAVDVTASTGGGEPPAGRPGVLVDVDGTLLDTNYLHVTAWTRALRGAGYQVTMERVHRSIGVGGPETMRLFTGAEPQEVAEAYDAEYQRLKQDIAPFPHAADLLAALADRGLAVILATSARTEDLDWILPAIGVPEDVLTGCTTSSDVERAKPDPELFLVAMERFHLDPARTVVIGDTRWDVEAALGAGIPCLAVTCGGWDADALYRAGACEVFADPEDLLDRLEESRLARL